MSKGGTKMSKIIFWFLVSIFGVSICTIFCGLAYFGGYGVQFFCTEWLVNHYGPYALIGMAVFRGSILFISAMAALTVSYFILRKQITDPNSDFREVSLYFHADQADIDSH
ncbi:MAG: hypothetical protein NTZ49_01300 [Candidatus Parcubacteria bacterium]|nr:hypothetical protein [Candidatus Parcubacteria bacterium]